MADPSAIDFDTVSKAYAGRAAVDGVSLAIPAGQFVAVVGASGSGKTTLLKMVNRLAEPSQGGVRIEGQDVAAQDAVQLRRRIGYVFQGVGLFPHMTVAENIAITPRLLGWVKADIAARVDELLDLVALPRTYAERFPDQLSGGERQRVGVARALAARPSILLMDEPFGALDPITREALGQATRALHDQLGLTTLMVTHDVQEAVLLADRIVVMANGKVLADDTPRALLAGHSDPDVAALMATPARQARAIAALMEAR
ncbi:ATP-binding cassette domain-containing protein [Caulobacter sp. SLTY]|uniref:ATP-binding cassette domain-containing protein n=1 Tax=Caulobacter sp. SLTY TaxID=2683262 RepID=UPI00141310B9|nr:ABC transporter ATP-binding protein [Caulobacter sp. SLTY]NBB14081.1 ATP-binding cassette domain-containing protein [Caulobacter sp. SLTY]